jgi:hypothetical protein
VAECAHTESRKVCSAKRRCKNTYLRHLRNLMVTFHHQCQHPEHPEQLSIWLSFLKTMLRHLCRSRLHSGCIWELCGYYQRFPPLSSFGYVCQMDRCVLHEWNAGIRAHLKTYFHTAYTFVWCNLAKNIGKLRCKHCLVPLTGCHSTVSGVCASDK